MPIKKETKKTEIKERNLRILKCDIYFWHTVHKNAKEFFINFKGDLLFYNFHVSLKGIYIWNIFIRMIFQIIIYDNTKKKIRKS